jgi:hypothetical protein
MAKQEAGQQDVKVGAGGPLEGGPHAAAGCQGATAPDQIATARP